MQNIRIKTNPEKNLAKPPFPFGNGKNVYESLSGGAPAKA